jgi:hypothetical protein
MLLQAKDMLDNQKKIARTETGWRKDKAEKNIVRLGRVINNLLELVRNEEIK